MSKLFLPLVTIVMCNRYKYKYKYIYKYKHKYQEEMKIPNDCSFSFSFRYSIDRNMPKGLDLKLIGAYTGSPAPCTILIHNLRKS